MADKVRIRSANVIFVLLLVASVEAGSDSETHFDSEKLFSHFEKLKAVLGLL